jgi:hypothetical protein
MSRKSRLECLFRFCKYTFLKVNDLCFFDYGRNSVFERLMSRVFFDIIITVLVRVKPDDERMAHTILSVYINFGCFPAPRRDIHT